MHLWDLNMGMLHRNSSGMFVDAATLSTATLTLPHVNCSAATYGGVLALLFGGWCRG